MNLSRYIIILMIWGSLMILPTVESGSCWASYNTYSGKCSQLWSRRVLYKDCCNIRLRGLSYTFEDLSNEEIFRSMITEGGISNCLPCSSFGRDVCADMECLRDEVCVDRNGQPRCECDPDCSEVDPNVPICGSDGLTYSNECTFRMTRCKERLLAVDLAYYGQCQDSCNNVTCVHGTCLEDYTGLPHCLKCPSDCEDKAQGSVCGKDENTYESACHLRLTSCEIGQAILKSKNGRCAGSINCSTFLCMDGKACAMDDGTVPLCSTCPSRECNQYRLSEICGSDNVTYDNRCAMQRAICDTGVYIKRQQFGHCASGIIRKTWRDSEDFFRYYLSLILHEHVSEPATTALIRRITTEEGTQEDLFQNMEDNEIQEVEDDLEEMLDDEDMDEEEEGASHEETDET